VKAYAIVLKDHLLSQEISKDCITAAKRFDIDIEVFDAIVGFKSKEKFKEHKIDKFLNHTIVNRPGHRGCFLSHFELWQRCLEYNEPIIILEHDGIFVRQLPEDVLEHFDEVLKLDCLQHWGEKDYNRLVEESLNDPIDYYYRPYDATYKHVGGYTVGAYGYIVKPKGAEKLIKFSKEQGVVCTEAMLGSKVVDVKTVTKTIVRLHKHYIGEGTKYSTTYNLDILN
jgi:GR25 family glycosyltransferase involved in LPS biosynthesis